MRRGRIAKATGVYVHVYKLGLKRVADVYKITEKSKRLIEAVIPANEGIAVATLAFKLGLEATVDGL